MHPSAFGLLRRMTDADNCMRGTPDHESSSAFLAMEKEPSGVRAEPDQLWRMAAEVARLHGVQATAAKLKLDAARLKQRMRNVGREAVSVL